MIIDDMNKSKKGCDKMQFRIGQGIDVHQLTQHRPLILGGVKISDENGLLGHSDADVLLHAIIDALLGAAGLGDIGHLFPDTDPKYKDSASTDLLEVVIHEIYQLGWKIQNIDATILAEAPKMQPYLHEMKQNIAQLCHIDMSQINLKATTMEQMGFIGQKQGMGAISVALLEK